MATKTTDILLTKTTLFSVACGFIHCLLISKDKFEAVVKIVELNVEIQEATTITAKIRLPNEPNNVVILIKASSGLTSGNITTAIVPTKKGTIYHTIDIVPPNKKEFFATLSLSADNPL